MPSVLLTLRQTTTAIPSTNGAIFRVSRAVETSVGLDKSVVVFKATSGAFSHFATIADLAVVFVDRDAAIRDGATFYRQSQLVRDWPTLHAMEEDIADTRARLRALVQDVSKVTRQAISDETITIESVE